MEQLAAHLAKKISASMGFDLEKEQVLAYGFTAMLQFIFLFFIALLAGVIGHCTYECLIIFFGVGFLRKSTGGAHSSTMTGCTTMSSLNIILLACLSKYVFVSSLEPYRYMMAYGICYLLCFFWIYRYVPLDSPNKRITSPTKIARLRKQSFGTLFVYAAITMILTLSSRRAIRLQSIANSLCLLSLWQCFTLTPAGAAFIHRLDLLFFKQKKTCQ